VIRIIACFVLSCHLVRKAFLEKEACHSGAHAPAYEPGIQERSVGSAWFWIPGSALRAAPE
jgi:hypothetical protein